MFLRHRPREIHFAFLWYRSISDMCVRESNRHSTEVNLIASLIISTHSLNI